MPISKTDKPPMMNAGDRGAIAVANAMSQALTPKQQKTAAVMESVKLAYYPTPNDQWIDVPLKRMQRAISTLDPETFAVTIHAETGMGKSTMIEQLLKDEKAFQPVPDGYGNFYHPVLYIKAPDGSIADLATRLLSAMKYDVIRRKSTDGLMLDVRRYLRRRGTRVVILDDFQHVLASPQYKGPAHVADTLKNMLQDPEWPIFIVLVGLPEIKEVVLRDPKDQLLRRVDDFGLLNMTLENDGEYLAAIIIELVQERAGLKLSADLQPDFIERLMYGAHYRWGLVMKIIYHSIEDALENDKDTVAQESWEEGYRRLVNGDYELETNVMASPEWRNIVRPVNRLGAFGPASLRSSKKASKK
ncbi:TniB family NTP-binding protein [Rhizobium phaseoli]|uniref:TniB family NTP-binding protein n=1 Tax=Rhizobium phaseoli TaxID=396 RepID=UPI0007EC0E13|nr:TniB family NTP-binding protein [Rhizobium phaseoli]ANL33892.1 AAA ATPase domain-containing protein [Rhizobium phaseoli]ANL97617.1 AAA ATPase domain-containing protein [Rhizobium phaseoli]